MLLTAAREGNVEALKHLLKDMRLDINAKGVECSPVYYSNGNLYPILFGISSPANI